MLGSVLPDDLFTCELYTFSRFPQLVVCHAGVVTEVSRVHFANDQGVSRATRLHYSSFGGIKLHGVSVPQHLKKIYLQITLTYVCIPTTQSIKIRVHTVGT